MSTQTSPIAQRIQACKVWPVCYYARVTVELTTPLHVGSGSESKDSDAGIVMDANGLAALPGSSIKGVLRHSYRAYAHEHPELSLPSDGDVFGRPAQGSDAGMGGRLAVSWGKVHDKDDRPVDRPLARKDILQDPVLKLASDPGLRDHVRLDHRGTAVRHAKFDEQFAAPGLRFTFDIEFWGSLTKEGEVTPEDSEAWSALLTLFSDPVFRLGGKGKRGFGAFRVVRHDHRVIRLDGVETSPDVWEGDDAANRHPATEWQTYRDLPAGMHEPLPDGGQAGFWDINSWLRNVPQAHRSRRTFHCELRPDSAFWMVAGSDNQSVSDSAPMSVRWVDWSRGVAKVGSAWVLPGSSIKGSLRHRTVYHYRRLTGVWADQTTDLSPAEPEEIEKLFGCVRRATPAPGGLTAPEEMASAGLVHIDDVIAPRGTVLAQLQNHVAIDRVLGGAMDHLLFDDQPLRGGQLAFDLHLVSPDSIAAQALEALCCALQDLCHGRLSLGAHSGRGYGYFQGSFQEIPNPEPS